MIGCFFKYVCWRTQLSETQTGLTFLKQVQQTLLEALANQDVDVYHNLAAIRPDWAENLPPNTALTRVDYHTIPTHWNGGLEGRLVEVQLAEEMWSSTTYLDLFCFSYPTENSEDFTLQIFFNALLYKNETIEHFLNSYHETLQKLLQQPETKLSEF